ncbi:unnamed protein product, partial [Lymnaea stagnalis]
FRGFEQLVFRRVHVPADVRRHVLRHHHLPGRPESVLRGHPVPFQTRVHKKTINRHCPYHRRHRLRLLLAYLRHDDPGHATLALNPDEQDEACFSALPFRKRSSAHVPRGQQNHAAPCDAIHRPDLPGLVNNSPQEICPLPEVVQLQIFLR